MHCVDLLIDVTANYRRGTTLRRRRLDWMYGRADLGLYLSLTRTAGRSAGEWGGSFPWLPSGA